MPKLAIDHLAVAAETLAQGAEYVQDTLGVTLSDVGYHPRMGTHNHLFSLGPSLYFEIIAVDPDADPPRQPRWFDLDNFTGAPRLNNWICSTDDFVQSLALEPRAGVPIEFERGPYRWAMAVPETGALPYGGAFPALLNWHGAQRPAPNLPDQNCRLAGLDIAHPEIDALRQDLDGFELPAIVTLSQAATKTLTATILTPNGRRVLS